MIDSHGQEGHSTTRSRLFDGTNYDYWKHQMMIYLQALMMKCEKSLKMATLFQQKSKMAKMFLNQRKIGVKMKRKRTIFMLKPKMQSYVS